MTFKVNWKQSYMLREITDYILCYGVSTPHISQSALKTGSEVLQARHVINQGRGWPDDARASTRPQRTPLRGLTAASGKARSCCGAPVRRGRAPVVGWMPVSMAICSSRQDTGRCRNNKHLFPGSCGKPPALLSPLSGALCIRRPSKSCMSAINISIAGAGHRPQWP